MNRSAYNLVFISTFIDEKFINKLINSVIENNNDFSILFVIINQTASKLVLPESELIDFFEINSERVSLSKARNIGINHLLNNHIIFEHIMFPDDDTTFSEVFFEKYKGLIKPQKNYLIDVYCDGTQELFKKNKYKEGVKLFKKDYEAAMSVNMVVCYSTFIDIGFFDERIGVGAKYGAGEDNDYFIRACVLSNEGFLYLKSLYNFHPSNLNKFSMMKLKHIISKYIKYGEGSIFTLCKHRMYFKAIKISFRALGGAIISLIKFDLKLFIALAVAFIYRLKTLIKCLIINVLKIKA